MTKFSYQSIELENVHSNLDEKGFVLIDGFCDPQDADYKLLEFVATLGIPFSTMSLGSCDDADSLEFKLESLIQSDGEVTKSKGLVVNCPNRFPLHTDSANLLYPHDGMLMYCDTDDPLGGDSILIAVNSLLEELTTQDIEMLKQSLFPFRCGLMPLLTEEEGRWAIRYDRFKIEENRQSLSKEQYESVNSLLERLDAALNKISINHLLKLQSGDLIIIDNRRVLHGRTALPSNSSRLLKRIRFYKQ